MSVFMMGCTSSQTLGVPLESSVSDVPSADGSQMGRGNVVKGYVSSVPKLKSTGPATDEAARQQAVVKPMMLLSLLIFFPLDARLATVYWLNTDDSKTFRDRVAVPDPSARG
jgi:hypothetical protein